jgi:hypothetical protein
MPFIEKLFAVFIVSALFTIFALTLSFAFPSGISVADIEGRWSDASEGLVLDITRCDEGFCGRRVEANGQCRRVVLSLRGDWEGIPQEVMQISGDYDWNVNVENSPHMIHVSGNIKRDLENGALGMALYGFDGSISRRGPALRLYLAKIGEAVCQPKPTS